VYELVYQLVSGAPLPFDERCDELAAEGRDARDHASPDQVKIGYGYLMSLSSGPLGWSQ
jgi:hypothetical protein